jgi:hypothetical protein
MSDAAKGGIAAGGLGGGLVLTDPVGLTSTLVAVKGNALQLMPAGLSLTTWIVPLILGALLIAFLVWANKGKGET